MGISIYQLMYKSIKVNLYFLIRCLKLKNIHVLYNNFKNDPFNLTML